MYCVLMCYCVVQALRTIYGCEKGGYDDGYQVSVYVCLVYYDIFIIRPDSNKESSFYVGKIALGRLMWVLYCVVDLCQCGDYVVCIIVYFIRQRCVTVRTQPAMEKTT